MRRIVRGERVKLPNVHRVRKDGTLHKYHRVTRARLPTDVPEDHPAFIAAWTKEEGRKGKPEPKAKSGTIAHGCEAYIASAEYREMSDSYRPVMRRHIDAIKTTGGKGMMTDLRTEHINADLEPLSPAVAKARRQAWRKLVPFWHRKGLVKVDVSMMAHSKRQPRTEGHIEWTQADVEKFQKHWGIETPQRHAMELLQWTGARASDVVRIGPGMIDRDGLLVFTQKKTGVVAYVPWSCPAMGMEGQRKTLLSYDTPHMVFLTTKYGKPRSIKAFSQWFSAAASDAKLPNLSAHGLRKYRMNQLAENGCTVLQMQSWVGHMTLAEVELYTRRVDRRRAFLGTEHDQNLVNHPERFTNRNDK